MKNLIKKILKEEIVNDVTDIQDELLMMPLDARKKLRDDLADYIDLGVEDESVEMDEQISYKGIPEIKAKTTVGKLIKWVKRFITDKATNFLINASMGEIQDTIEILDVMDPESTVGIFKPKAMYLGGGIDFAKDAVSWRGQVEDFFGPTHVVKDERLLTLVTTGDLSYQGLSTPALLNPMRAETVREADKEFQDMFKKWKSNQLTPEEFKIFQEKIREQIVHQDLYMLQVCDTNLINFDGTAGAGTFGEAQISALKNQQVFLWLTNGMKLSNVSPWLLPSVTKVLVEDELWPFLSNFK
jgi:hypothetical protein|tara:strand:- start:165 stop:1061 length:897 start_codon:yes stop_codon:yes gene_type:complete